MSKIHDYMNKNFEIDGQIYIHNNDKNKSKQSLEIDSRSDIAKLDYDDYLYTVSRSHSIPVMDVEVKKYIDNLPYNSCILDVGGCWGWHWRNINHQRPDISIILIDFIKENLYHAINVLPEVINKNIYLLQADACSIPFPDDFFSGYWSVQTHQHIPNYNKAFSEAYRVLKRNSKFATYYLNIQPWHKILSFILRKKYIIDDIVPSQYYLRRGDKKISNDLEKIFRTKVSERYTEVLFQPPIRTQFCGVEGSIVGSLDSMLSSSNKITRFIARQVSYHISLDNKQIR